MGIYDDICTKNTKQKKNMFFLNDIYHWEYQKNPMTFAPRAA
jgi:hypothetical protein